MRGLSAPPPLSPKKSVSSITITPVPPTETPQPEKPSGEIISPRERAPTFLGEKEGALY